VLFSDTSDFVLAEKENERNGKYRNRAAQKTSVHSFVFDIGKSESGLAQQSILILTTSFLA